MKRIYSLLVLLAILLTTCLVCFADDTVTDGEGDSVTDGEDTLPDEFEAAFGITSDATKVETGYNYGSEISVTYTVEFINIPEAANGLAAVEFALGFDPYVLEPKLNGAEDEDGDFCDFTAYCTGGPEGWAAIGMVDAENGYIDMAYWDNMTYTVINEGAVMTVTLPFTVRSDAKEYDVNRATYIAINYCTAYSSDLKTEYQLDTDSIMLYLAVQPDEDGRETLPEEAIPLDIAGYRGGDNNFIASFNGGTTMGEYVSLYGDTTDAGLTGYAVALVNIETNEIEYVDLSDGDKSSVEIDYDHYLIAVSRDNADEFTAFCESAAVGEYVQLYNVNPEGIINANPEIELDGAGFTVYSADPVLKGGADAVYDEEDGVVDVYVDDITVDEFVGMFENDVTVTDGDGNELAGDAPVTTGTRIDCGEDGVDIVVMGDVNGDGLVNQYDYILVRRHYLETFELKGVFLRAACISNGESVVVYDYIYVKRAYFGTLDLAVLCPGA